jgi:hypothetical protein
MTRKGFEDIMRAAGKAVARTTREVVVSTEPPITLHLDPIELGALDLWIADQPDPIRSDAVRMLLKQALARKRASVPLIAIGWPVFSRLPKELCPTQPDRRIEQWALSYLL